MGWEPTTQAFVGHFYMVFDTNRPALTSLFQEHSMMTFEGNKLQGPAAIVGKLTSLSFQKCQHTAKTIDAQPTFNGGILVFVSGDIAVRFYLFFTFFSPFFVCNCLRLRFLSNCFLTFF